MHGALTPKLAIVKSYIEAGNRDSRGAAILTFDAAPCNTWRSPLRKGFPAEHSFLKCRYS